MVHPVRVLQQLVGEDEPPALGRVVHAHLAGLARHVHRPEHAAAIPAEDGLVRRGAAVAAHVAVAVRAVRAAASVSAASVVSTAVRPMRPTWVRGHRRRCGRERRDTARVLVFRVRFHLELELIVCFYLLLIQVLMMW